MTRALRITLLVCSVGIAAAPAFANPQGGQVVGGAAAINSQGATTTITQSSASAIINWNTFNIGVGETTKFIQPDASSVALNRVTGGLGPSQIYGTISANGRVFLVNPDGILFGAGSRVDTGGFLATTHDISNADFMAGRYKFDIPGKPDASIVNLGSITAADTGIVALVAPGVRNAGIITANLGTVALSAGNGFTLDFYGDKLITLQVGDAIAAEVKDVATGQPLNALVKNEGTLRANGGRVHLTAVAARQIVDSVVNNSGVIEANSVGIKNGEIVLGAATAATEGAGASKQTVKVSGTISAAGKKAGETGGKVQITGEDIWLTAVRIDASGASGGGKVLIGGDVGGGTVNSLVAGKVALENSPIGTATWLMVDAASSIDASATQAGDGGKVVLWSDRVTSFAGLINATGGAAGGNGGFAEVSGRQLLNFAGAVDLLAAAGETGTLLLDPYDITISTAADANGSFFGGSFTPSGTSIINVTTLQNALASANVLVTTGGSGSPGADVGDINVNTDITWAGASTLTLSAFHSILINNGAIISNTGSGNLVLRADNSGTGVGTVTFTTPGTVDFHASSGLVSLYYNPASYVSGTNYSGNVSTNSAIANQFTVYMLVNTLTNLQAIGGSLGQNYALGRDIDATGFISFITGSTYTGQFDGSGGLGSNYTISNLTGSPFGLFGAIGVSGSVRNLNLANVTISAGIDGALIGALAGRNDGTIDNVHVRSGSVSGGAHSGIGAGGLVGQNNGTITNSSSAADVSVGDGTMSQVNNAGGLVGSNFGLIQQSSASGTVDAGSFAYAGGLVGANQNVASAVIDASFATGDVSSAGTNVYLGGLVGSNMPQAKIKDSAATGDVTASGTAAIHNGVDCNLTSSCAWVVAGGFVGQNYGFIAGTPASVGSSCVSGATCASGDVFVGTRGTAGGFVGDNFGTINYAFATGAVMGDAGSADTTHLFNNTTLLGGFAGSNNGTITFSNAFGDVGGVIDHIAAGGFVADNAGTVLSSHAYGMVTGSSHSAVGGFVVLNSSEGAGPCTGCLLGTGQNTDARIVSSTADGPFVVAGDNSIAGGFAAYNDGALEHVTAQSTVAVDHDSIAGGLVAVQDYTGHVIDGTAYGAVFGFGERSILGGLVGLNGGTVAFGDFDGVVVGLSDSYIGGLVGVNLGIVNHSSVSSWAFGIGAENIVGGIAGLNVNVIDNTTAFADVVSGANSLVGGLVGLNIGPPGVIANSSHSGWVGSAGGQMTSLPDLPAWMATCAEPLCGFAKGLTLPYTFADNSVIALPANQISLQQLLDYNQPTPVDFNQTSDTPPAGNASDNTSGQGRPPVNPGPPQSSGPPPGVGIGRTLSEQQFSGAPPLNETRFLPSEVVVQIANTVPQDRIEEMARQLGIAIVAQQSINGAGRKVFRFRSGDGRDIRDLIRTLEKNQAIASAQPNYVFSLAQAAPPPAAPAPAAADPADLAQSDVAARTTTLPTGDSAQYVIDMLKLPSIHQRVRGRGIVIAVVDSEIDSQHPDLRGGIVERFNATESPSHPHSHGTGMAGAIAAKSRLLGVAPEVRILAIKAFDESASSAEATSFQILSGLDHAVARGARIINMSFAGPRDLMVERTLKAASDKGIVLIAAAGNAGPKSPPLFPAADPNVIAVSAVDYTDKPFVMANRGKHIAVVAPGVDVLVPAPNGGYQLTTGTSVAAAHVSGVVALLLEAKPSLTPREVRAILTRTAKPVLTRDKAHQTGAGLVDPIHALQTLIGARTVDNAAPTTVVR